MNKDVVKQILDKSNVYKIVHTQWYGNIAPKDAEDTKYVSVDHIGYHKAFFDESADPAGQPWNFSLEASLTYVNAPDEFVNALVLMCMADKLGVIKRNDEYNNETGIPCVELYEQLPKVAEITYTVGIRGVDGGSDWADPENDLRTTKTAVLGFRDFMSEQWFTKSFGYGGDLWGLCEVYDYLTQARELGRTPEFTEKQREETVGFEFMQHVFKLAWPLRKDRVTGECVSGTWVDFEEDNNLLSADKGDSYEEHFSYHLGNHAYAIGNRVYLNGGLWFEDFPSFINHLGVPDCATGSIVDHCLSQGFYRSEQVLHILAHLEPERLCEFVGRSGDSSCTVDSKPYVDGVTLDFPVISKDGSHTIYEVSWKDESSETLGSPPVSQLFSKLAKAGLEKEVEYIRYFGVWVQYTLDAPPVQVGWDKSRELDKVIADKNS